MGYTLDSAKCINDYGWIAGTAKTASGKLRAYLLIPVSETAPLLLHCPNGGESLISGEAYSIECLVRVSDAENPSIYDTSDAQFSITIPAPDVICPIVDIDPDTLNLASKGKWITAYLHFPADCNVPEISPESILLNAIVSPDWFWFDVITNLVKAKFSRAAVHALVQPGEATLTITGEFADGTRFEGADTIRVIDNADTKDPQLSYTCTEYPLMDFNKDCKVDMKDYVIFMSHWLECTREPQEACFGDLISP